MLPRSLSRQRIPKGRKNPLPAFAQPKPYVIGDAATYITFRSYRILHRFIISG
jgi:hypothetical protein